MGAAHAGHVELRRGNDLYLDAEPFQPAVGATLGLALGAGGKLIVSATETVVIS